MPDDPRPMNRYRELARTEPRLFANPPGCPTRILLDDKEIAAAQAEVRKERAAAGHPVGDLRVGVLAEDHYIGYVLRDAVRFADGKAGLYNRVAATGGVAVLPILDGGIALIRIFRHALRAWSLEAPQGLVPPGADPAEEVRRELMEEMGAATKEVFAMGILYTSTALTSEDLKMYAARIAGVGKPQHSEGISGIELIARQDIDGLLLRNEIRDGPTTSLIAHARLRGLL